MRFSQRRCWWFKSSAQRLYVVQTKKKTMQTLPGSKSLLNLASTTWCNFLSSEGLRSFHFNSPQAGSGWTREWLISARNWQGHQVNWPAMKYVITDALSITADNGYAKFQETSTAPWHGMRTRMIGYTLKHQTCHHFTNVSSINDGDPLKL